jgi:hypothetical protein
VKNAETMKVLGVRRMREEEDRRDEANLETSKNIESKHTNRSLWNVAILLEERLKVATSAVF